ncbi:Multiple RNA-binding domain-containing protein 1 [Colletotrichum shisoi]|uniref:Multiple RNA-binding domain-containing protein 1 n=1 Tax=Colletotrichum shisoi TaxID=2078593 RepID=A0A5Q4BED2_9PEZI|nr:Multiple RNA-binding domain-containing protein 1 [Colletotrichum shisoi]
MAFSRSADQPAALAEGRRIYLGNLLYIAQPAEIEEMLRDNGFPEYEKIHISMDPVSGRNPGYCFVDFLGRDDADRALASLDASIRGRPLKVGPCEPKKQQQQQRTATATATAAAGGGRWKSDREPAAFQRWGDWSGQSDRAGAGDDSEDKGGVQQGGPSAAIKHFDEVVANDTDGRRLYVGGLAKMVNQQHNQDEMREILGDFNPVAIGRRITPHESKRTAPGNHHYCFVHFATVEEAAAARDALDGKPWAGERLRVNVARPLPDKLRERAHPKDTPASPARDNTVWSERPTRSNRSPGGERSSWRKPGGNGSKSGGDSADGSSGNGNGNGNSSKPSQPLRSLASGNWRQRE